MKAWRILQFQQIIEKLFQKLPSSDFSFIAFVQKKFIHDVSFLLS